jgi:hypothetical protein
LLVIAPNVAWKKKAEQGNKQEKDESSPFLLLPPPPPLRDEGQLKPFTVFLPGREGYGYVYMQNAYTTQA